MKLLLSKIKDKWQKFKNKSPKGYWFIKYIIFPCLWFVVYAIAQFTILNKFLIINIFSMALTALVLVYVLTHPVAKPKDKDYNNTRPKRLKIILAFLIALLIANLIFGILSGASNQASANQESINELFKTYPVQILFMAIVMAPVFEETIYRRALISFSSRKWTIVSYIITIFIFAISHMENTSLMDIWVLISYMMPGIAFGGCYIVNRRISNSMLLHMAYNTVAALPLILTLIK